MEVAGRLLIIWVGLGDGRGGRIAEGFFLVYFFNPARVLEGHFYYGKAKVNVKDFLTRLGAWFAIMDRYFFPICVYLMLTSFFIFIL